VIKGIKQLTPPPMEELEEKQEEIESPEEYYKNQAFRM
jgi:hypothetical protein